MTRQSGYRRDGFTLIELLVVISIIAVLMALTTAAVMKGRDAVVRAKNRNQMDQITNAASSFASAEVNSRVGALPPAPFRLQKQYTGTEPELVYLKQLFPRMPYIVGPVVPGSDQYHPDGTGLPDVTLVDGNQVALFFLTGGEVTQYTGFSNNPIKPFSAGAPGESRRGPYLQLQTNMYSKNPPGVNANQQAWLVDVYGVPYAIFIAGKKGNYAGQGFPAGSLAAPAVSQPNSVVSPYIRSSKYENPLTLQIISAGPDKKFGPGGNWASGTAIPLDGQDDVSNFSTAVIGAGPQ